MPNRRAPTLGPLRIHVRVSPCDPARWAGSFVLLLLPLLSGCPGGQIVVPSGETDTSTASGADDDGANDSGADTTGGGDPAGLACGHGEPPQGPYDVVPDALLGQTPTQVTIAEVPEEPGELLMDDVCGLLTDDFALSIYTPAELGQTTLPDGIGYSSGTAHTDNRPFC